MLSTLIELLALAGVTNAAGTFWGAGAAWLVGSVSLLFVGYALSGSAIDAEATRLLMLARARWQRQVARENASNGNSPHPTLTLDPELERVAKRAARARSRRAALGDRTPALARHDYADAAESDFGE